MRNAVIIMALAAAAAAVTGCAGNATVKDASGSASYSQNGVTVSTSGSAGEIDQVVP